MPQFTVNATRYDPYKNFKFKVLIGTRYVAGVSKISALKRTTETVSHRSGGDHSVARISPGRTKFDPITLESGVTHDTEFERFANKVWDYNNAQAPADLRRKEMSLADFRQELTLELWNEAGQPALRWFVHRCWVSEFNAMMGMDANANAVLIQTIKLENEGWTRDLALVEPPEVATFFDDPTA
jgi:phage tail-like protein